MAWPKGKPRKLKTESVTPVATAQKQWAAEKVKSDPRHKMKARPNWDDYETGDSPENELHIPQDQFPDGMDLQWVAVSVLGQPLTKERGQFERKGWTPVHQSDFDGLFNGRWMKKGEEGEINFKGLVLMARPLEYSLRAKQVEAKRAREQVAVKEAALKGGDMPITLDPAHPSALRSNVVNRTFERITIPNDGE